MRHDITVEKNLRHGKCRDKHSTVSLMLNSGFAKTSFVKWF